MTNTDNTQWYWIDYTQDDRRPGRMHLGNCGHLKAARALRTLQRVPHEVAMIMLMVNYSDTPGVYGVVCSSCYRRWNREGQKRLDAHLASLGAK